MRSSRVAANRPSAAGVAADQLCHDFVCCRAEAACQVGHGARVTTTDERRDDGRPMMVELSVSVERGGDEEQSHVSRTAMRSSTLTETDGRTWMMLTEQREVDLPRNSPRHLMLATHNHTLISTHLSH